MTTSGQIIHLKSGRSELALNLSGAEPVYWQVDGRELLWRGDERHWNRSAPLLFPVVGTSRNSEIIVEGRRYPMPQHGFAKDMPFETVSVLPDSAELRLRASDASRGFYPFSFNLNAHITLEERSFSITWKVINEGREVMPYALGFHPGFLWPFSIGSKEEYRVGFEQKENACIPAIARGGLLSKTQRVLAFSGSILSLSPELFSGGALVFLDARSRRMSFSAPDGHTISLTMENFPHLALWTKPDAPFLSMEAWTGHADWEDTPEQELSKRDSLILLQPGGEERHKIIVDFQ